MRLPDESVRRQFEGKGWLSDPCYANSDNSTGSSPTFKRAGVDLGDITGRWQIEAVRGDENRCFKLEARKIGAAKMSARTFHTVAVDAGLMGIFNESDAGYDWDRCCTAMFDPRVYDNDTILYDIEEYVASTTGYGDGTYTATVERDQDGNAVALSVSFADEDEADDEDY